MRNVNAPAAHVDNATEAVLEIVAHVGEVQSVDTQEMLDTYLKTESDIEESIRLLRVRLQISITVPDLDELLSGRQAVSGRGCEEVHIGSLVTVAQLACLVRDRYDSGPFLTPDDEEGY